MTLVAELKKRGIPQGRIGRIVKNGGNGGKRGLPMEEEAPEFAPPARGRKGEHIDIEPIHGDFMTVTVVGDSPIHVHAMSAKTAIQIEEHAQGKDDAKVNKRKRPPKDPWSDFVNALHLLPGKKLPWNITQSKIVDGVPRLPFPIGCEFPYFKDVFGFPVAGIAKGVRQILQAYNYTKIERAGIWMRPADAKFGQLMPLVYDKLIFERVPCRVGPYKVADMHYRGMFVGWSAKIMIEFDKDSINAKQLVNAINRAGRYCGLGEQRKSSPQNPGDEGMYHVKTH